jgi:hypothetical protein
MPNLQKLVLDGIEDNSPTLVEGGTFLPQLRALHVCESTVLPIIRSLATPPMLREVEFQTDGTEDLYRLKSFLSPVLTSLVQVQLSSICGTLLSVVALQMTNIPFLGLEDILRCIGLRSMTSLRVLHLTIPTDNLDAWKHIPTVLDTITSCVIEHVKFTIYLFDFPPVEEDLWVKIPSVIAKPNLKHLNDLEFYIRGERSQANESNLRILLRSLGSIKALRVCWLNESAKVYENVLEGYVTLD